MSELIVFNISDVSDEQSFNLRVAASDVVNDTHPAARLGEIIFASLDAGIIDSALQFDPSLSADAKVIVSEVDQRMQVDVAMHPMPTKSLSPAQAMALTCLHDIEQRLETELLSGTLPAQKSAFSTHLH